MDSTLSNSTVGPSTGLANAGTPASPQTLGNNITTPATINASALSAQPVSIPTPPPSVAPPPGFVPTAGAIQQGAQTGTAIQQPTQAPTSPAQPVNPVSQANAQNTGLTTGNPQGLPSQDQLAQNTANAQGTYDQTTSQINQLMQELGMQSTDVGNMQNSVGISGLQTNLSDLNNQLAQAKANYATQTQQIGSQNIPSLFVTGQQAIARAAANSNIGALSAQVQAAQGNLTTAFNTINQTISEKYKPIQDQLTAQETFLKDNYDQLTAQQKIQAQGVQDTITAQKANIANEQSIVNTASKGITDMASKGLIDPTTSIKVLGELTSGTKTLEQIGQELGVSFGSDGTVTGSPSGAGSGAINTAQALAKTNPGLGALTNLATPLSTVIQQYGIGNLAQAIISQENSQLDPSLNNPGDVKYYAGMPNATNSGINASDGGTWAQFDTQADGVNAVADLVQNAANGQSSIYGQNPTFQDFMNKYTNTQPTGGTQGGVPGTTGSATVNATAQGYATQPVPGTGGMTQALIDQAAMIYATTGKLPATGNGGGVLSYMGKKAIENRAGEMTAGGNVAGNEAAFKSLGTSLTQQTNYLNTTQRSYDTAQQNLSVIQNLMSSEGINQSNVPIINQLTNSVKSGLTDPGTIAAFNSALSGLRAEYAQVLSRGGEVTDTSRNAANSLIPDNLTPAQMQQITTQLSLEGGNAIKEATGQVKQIQDQINGIISPATSTSNGTPATAQDRTQYTPISFTIPKGYDFNYQRDLAQAQQAIQNGTSPAIVWGHFNTLYK